MIRGKKILGALLAFTLCFSMVIPAQADDISDAKKKQQELEQQKNTAEAEKSELSSELDSIVSKMEKTQSDLTAKETEINDAETELVTAKANEDDQYQTMKLRIKYMYENGSNEFLEILMEANSIADLLNKAEYINKISKCDRELLVEYEDTRKDVENRENALKKEYAELESLQDELAGEQANVEKLLADKNIQIDNLTSEISSNADKLKQLIAAAEEEKIPYQLEVMSGGHTGTNADSIVVAQDGVESVVATTYHKDPVQMNSGKSAAEVPYLEGIGVASFDQNKACYLTVSFAQDALTKEQAEEFAKEIRWESGQ